MIESHELFLMHWTHALYDDLMIDLFLDRQADAEITRDVELLRTRLELGAGSRVLDQGCGVGTHAQPLAALGCHVVGIDLVPAYVAEAARRCPEAEYATADAAAYVATPPCDAVYSFGSCIGHGSDADTRATFAAAWASLRDGGRYVVETLGAYGVLRNFERHSILRGTTRRGPVTVLRETRLDLARGTMHKDWTFCLPDGTVDTRQSTLRFYAPHELVERMQDAGFLVEAVLGGSHGRPLALDDSRILLVARKESRS